MNEQTWQRTVVEAAELAGWTVDHTRKSIGGRKGGWTTANTVPGKPDLMLWRPRDGAQDRDPTLIFAELKTNRGRLSTAQDDVIRSLRAAGQLVYVWRPRDWDTGDVQQVLMRHRHAYHARTT